MKRLIILFLGAHIAFAGLQEANSIIKRKMNYQQKLKLLIHDLVEDGFYFAAIPWVKEYLVRSSGKHDYSFEKDFSTILKQTGTAQFETLPSKYLLQSRLNTVKYILGKKLIKRRRFNDAQKVLESVNPNHSIYPFALHALGVLYSIQSNYEKANLAFNMCANTSKVAASNSKVENQQITENKDYCILGIARNLFANNQFKEAELKYLDIPKSSPVWPYVLFDEAWNSYYLENYNRTLGKLVTYKAPIFDKFFDPEFDVLRALSYLRLCLYQDAKSVADDFYQEHMKDTQRLRRVLRSKRKNYQFYYKLYEQHEGNKSSGNQLLDKLLESFQTDGAISGFKERLGQSYIEYNRAKDLARSTIKTSILTNLKEVITTQREIIGAYVRARLIQKYTDLYKAFEGLSYLKLEILNKRKAQLYNFKPNSTRQRGDFKYLKRNDKQYFWDFIGEFWADELGDYVFALKSEC